MTTELQALLHTRFAVGRVERKSEIEGQSNSKIKSSIVTIIFPAAYRICSWKSTAKNLKQSVTEARARVPRTHLAPGPIERQPTLTTRKKTLPTVLATTDAAAPSKLCRTPS